MAALSGEKTLAELAAEFGVHPTMISNWKQELVKRATELFARGSKAPGAEGKPSMRVARGCAQRLLLPAAAGICGGTRASEAARPDFHRLSSLRQPPAPGGAVAGGGFGGGAGGAGGE